MLAGKKGLIVGIANKMSIAWGCARIFNRESAELAITYQNAKAEKYVRPQAEELHAPIICPLDVCDEQQMDILFAQIEKQWGKLDFVLHSIAFAPADDLHGRVTDCSRDGFLMAMDISCHSFQRLAKRAEPLMTDGGALLTVTYMGSERVIDHYGVMGPVKAALESTTRYMAAELGPKNIRCHAISPGPLLTRAASGIAEFETLMDQATRRAPGRRLVTIDEIGELAAFLASDRARSLTGDVAHIDGGYNIMG
ncbi:enoyl-ACP reductase FabI [Thalassospira lucentensis]|uniref:enoyl-ACP reductase FabI n=1 Tax=Thalassospira lucentensis TaxID=168935 RepID=UPI000411B9E1|nr:enoyl-ACP reductase FabI [Thalassospira lucentensis]RCK28923.1 short-chain dehydrogenase [Thalassospira lucentensis MCCC 1A00383 = DSM 14000]